MAKSSTSFVFVCFILLILGKSEAQLAPALYVFGDSTVDAGNNNDINTYAKSNYAPYGVDFPCGVTGRPTNGRNAADFIAQLAPALYVFGGSTVDAGNNNDINTYAKSNYGPYGVDFPCGVTGRPTNGYTMADFIAESLGLKLPPAFRLVDTQTYNDCQGFNYASSSAGILPESGFKGSLSLGEQVGLFRKTVEEYLPLHLKNKDDLSNHLSKSIFLFVMGVNDYGLNFLKKKNSGQPFDEDAAA
ncbi:hypothetical protein L484_027087 [Morus notabilis]|uniref:GDSL esterase/lipase n=1 Tax=Morus notabilis TaxID=981085 RepID=W9S0W1_9ROSA|nr:hypothetical protein L484_027087 [Morus notabilis]